MVCRCQFNIGEYTILAEGGTPFLRKDSLRDKGLDYVLKMNFINSTRKLAGTMPGELSLLLHEKTSIFYLDSHGCDNKGVWCYEKDLNDLESVEKRIKTEIKRGVQSAIINVCNPGSLIQGLAIPVLYPQTDVSQSSIDEVMALSLPVDYPQSCNNSMKIINDYLDALYHFHRALGNLDEETAEHILKDGYTRRKESAKNILKCS